MNAYAQRYHELVALRDTVNAKVAPLQAELDAANAVAVEAQARANAIAAEISKQRGGQAWLDLKREIATLTRALGKIPPLPAVPAQKADA